MPPRHDVAKYSVEKNVRPYCTSVIDLDPHSCGFIYLEPLHGIHHGALSDNMQYFHNRVNGTKRVTLINEVLRKF